MIIAVPPRLMILCQDLCPRTFTGTQWPADPETHRKTGSCLTVDLSAFWIHAFKR